MPRQKFCSVPGCLSTTDVIKREQETFLSAYCQRCSVQRPCRCPAPDIYTTRRETRTKFASWCSAIGLRSPGYYINVCYKHFSAGCPSRSCPNPDVVKPVWEKHVKDKSDEGCEAILGAKRSVVVPRKRKRRRRSHGIVGPPPKAAAVILQTQVMNTAGGGHRSTSLLRDALLLPRASDGNPKRQKFPNSTDLQNNVLPSAASVTPPATTAVAAASPTKQVIVMLTPTYSTLPTSIALPQTPVPLSQLTNSAVNMLSTDTATRSSVTPPSSSSSSLGTKDEDDDESIDIMDDLMKIDDKLLMEMMDPRRADDKETMAIAGSTQALLSLPLLDQSDDPYLNEGGEPLSFVTDELDETVQKWMETCEANFLPI